MRFGPVEGGLERWVWSGGGGSKRKDGVGRLVDWFGGCCRREPLWRSRGVAGGEQGGGLGVSRRRAGGGQEVRTKWDGSAQGMGRK